MAKKAIQTTLSRPTSRCCGTTHAGLQGQSQHVAVGIGQLYLIGLLAQRPQQLLLPSFTENTKSSTVNMTYRFPNSKWSLSTTANIAQRTSDSTLTVSFPNLTASMSQIYPFKRKRAVGKERWYEKIKLSYSGQFQNSLTAKQDVFFQKSLVKDWRNGARHSVPISATFSVFKYLNLTPSLQINDRMYTNKVRRQWDPNASAEVCDTTYGFYSVWDFQGLALSRHKIYGFFQPMKFLGDKVKMIRHVLTPTISFSEIPTSDRHSSDTMAKYHYMNSQGEMVERQYSMFPNAVFGVPGTGRSGSVSLSLANNPRNESKERRRLHRRKEDIAYRELHRVAELQLCSRLDELEQYQHLADAPSGEELQPQPQRHLGCLHPPAVTDRHSRARKRSSLESGKRGSDVCRRPAPHFSYTFNNNTFKRGKDKDKNKDKTVGVAARTTMTSMKITTKGRQLRRQQRPPASARKR